MSRKANFTNVIQCGKHRDLKTLEYNENFVFGWLILVTFEEKLSRFKRQKSQEKVTIAYVSLDKTLKLDIESVKRKDSRDISSTKLERLYIIKEVEGSIWNDLVLTLRLDAGIDCYRELRKYNLTG